MSQNEAMAPEWVSLVVLQTTPTDPFLEIILQVYRQGILVRTERGKGRVIIPIIPMHAKVWP